MEPTARPSEPPSSSRLELLREVTREAEQVMHAQIRSIEELDDKTEHLIHLTVAALAGGVTIGTFAMPNAASSPLAPLAALLLGGVGNVWGLSLLLRSYNFRLSTRAAVNLGPDPSWLAGVLRQPRWSLEEHFENLVVGYGAFYRDNLQTMSTTALLRAQGLRALFGALVAYALALILIAGVPIWS